MIRQATAGVTFARFYWRAPAVITSLVGYETLCKSKRKKRSKVKKAWEWWRKRRISKSRGHSTIDFSYLEALGPYSVTDWFLKNCVVALVFNSQNLQYILSSEQIIFTFIAHIDIITEERKCSIFYYHNFQLANHFWWSLLVYESSSTLPTRLDLLGLFNLYSSQHLPNHLPFLHVYNGDNA